ncbi:MAG TPA: tRNA uridine-5-carboxymethylaminomethyl(34) synthesis GTPase MnmE [Pseudobdellovibrionaceae bacterium]|nr:tRNA uridine-5-carboxymethylaminomethyl(34) synthesis GTPase MnmE [Pseudobdellovibrionaceae bacterium]
MITPRDRDTICAVSTPPGVGGISVLRLSGEKALEILRKIAPFFPEKPESHKAYFGTLTDPSEGEAIDEVLVTWFDHGKSFTGEKTAEISCHGNPLICGDILHHLVAAGARPADRGEFTYRSFMNGRIDLVQAESVLSLIESRSSSARRLALRQLKGDLSERLESLEDNMIWCLAHIEAGIDFATEGLKTESDVLLIRLETVEKSLDQLVKSFRTGRVLKDGVRIVFAGRPNVGKSSLLNNFLEEDRAIVTDIAGTTRDVVEGETQHEGIRISFVDTAGLREADDQIEKIGIARSRKAQDDADIIFFVFDASVGLETEDLEILRSLDPERTLILANKVDSAPSEVLQKAANQLKAETFFTNETSSEAPFSQKVFFVSALDKMTRASVLDVLTQRLRAELNESASVLAGARHFERLSAALEAVRRGTEILKEEAGAEFAAVDLKEALLAVQETIGKRFDDQIMDRVFKEFCIGK